jgi:uncharacterized membrane protein (UPF0127 family)
MSKKNKKKTNQSKPQPKPFFTLKMNLIISVLVIAVAVAAYFMFFRIPADQRFVKQGEVTYYKAGTRAIIRKIDVEVASTVQKRTQGLMYRKSMGESNGMLFIFEKPDMHQFWMKNTYISLDIAFIDSTGVIDTIYRHTKTLDETGLPSRRRVQFVIETNAGFSDKNGIKEGDLISFETEKK